MTWALVLLVACLLGAPSVGAAEILFREDFETGDLPGRGWFDISRWGTELRITETEYRAGRASLEVRYRRGSTGPKMRHAFAPQDRVYTRYYRKWASDWRWPETGPHDTYLFAMLGRRLFPPTRTYLTVYTDSIYMGPPAWQPGTVGLITRAILQGRDYWLPPSLTPPPPPFELNRWYCIETMASLNTPGRADGYLALWLDGAPVYDLTGLVLRDLGQPDLRFDQFMFGPWFHGGVPQRQSTWLDALVVATDQVGCLEDNPRPS